MGLGNGKEDGNLLLQTLGSKVGTVHRLGSQG